MIAEPLLRDVTFTTPKGNVVQAVIRTDTTDWNTINACCTADEYGLGDRDWAGWAIDVGAHIGGATLALLADNPTLNVYAIEALPANVAVLRENLELNGLTERCVVVEAAADCGKEPVAVAYGTSEGEFAREHRYIGGAVWQDEGPTGTRVTLDPISLSDVVAQVGDIALMKIDCEGCEWSFLDDPAIARVSEIRGEYHPRRGFGPARLRELLEPTHYVTLDDALDFGPFAAVRRG